MEDFIGLLFFWLFIGFIFWGLAYATGSLLITLISPGNGYPDSLLKNYYQSLSTFGENNEAFCKP